MFQQQNGAVLCTQRTSSSGYRSQLREADVVADAETDASKLCIEVIHIFASC
jgi:hypothetical protein